MVGVDPEFGISMLRLWVAAGSAALLVLFCVLALFQPHSRMVASPARRAGFVIVGAVLGAALPLLLMDRLWRLVYSQIPLKDGVDRAPEFLAVNLLALCVSAAISGSHTRSMRPAFVKAVFACAAAGAALAASAGSTPAAYAFLVLLLAPAGSMFGCLLRRLT